MLSSVSVTLKGFIAVLMEHPKRTSQAAIFYFLILKHLAALPLRCLVVSAMRRKETQLSPQYLRAKNVELLLALAIGLHKG